MDPRRGSRPSQVRPRPPSPGRPVTVRTRTVSPSPTRLAGYRRIERRRGIPRVMGAVLAVAVVALGGAILWVGSGAVGPFVAGIARGFGGFVAQVSEVAGSPTPTQLADVSDAPTIQPPDSGYTNRDTIDLTVNVPAAVAGLDGYSVRLYVTVADKEAELVTEEPVGALSGLTIPGIELSNGRNDFQASIAGPGGESELSEIATVILDTSKPKVTVISPKNNAQVTKPQVTIKGKSQAGSQVRLQNQANGAISTVTAGKDGLWEAVIAVANGGNVISLTATDPAGNANTAELRLVKGSGSMTATLSGSSYRFRASRLPRRLTLTVTVQGADGKPLQGATALFTISVPSLEAIVSGELTTNGNGTASFSTMIPKGATPGGGLATVLVTAKGEDDTTDRQVLTIVE